MSGINISSILPTDRNANLLRAINKYGMNLADFAALTTTSRFTGFGNGTGYTVSSWISDGVFANLAAVQSTYPIVQSGSDKVDWVLLQSAIDFLIYGALGNSIRGSMKRKLHMPAGHYNINRSLHIGYALEGTPPANLNGNGYVSITLEGEGPQSDPSGNGMTGTTILTDDLTYPGIVISRPQQVILRDFTIVGPYDNYLASNNPYLDSDGWDRTQWRQSGMADANWLGGAAVNIGVGIDLYSNTTAAAAYPARVLPSYFGGGTTTSDFGSLGGTEITLEDVNIRGFIIGFGRPHGDTNDEFIRMHRGVIANCVHSFVCGHSQNRNVSLHDVNFAGFHTAITSVGGLTGNANLHGTYSNLHFGQGYQLFDHPQSDWSGPLTLRDCYAESFFRLGTWTENVKLDGGFYSFIEQEGTRGITYNHYDCGRLILDNCTLTLRHGLFGKDNRNDTTKIEIIGGTRIRTGNGSSFTSHANAAQIDLGHRYMSGVYSKPGGNDRIIHSTSEIYQGGLGHRLDTFSSEGQITYFDQSYTDYFSQFPNPYIVSPEGATLANGSVHRYPVPKIIRDLASITVTSRSGFDLTCPRYTLISADIKADVGDIFAIKPDGVDSSLEASTWFTVVSISGSNMVLRQMNNFYSTSTSNYFTNGFYQVEAGSHTVLYICTRIRQNSHLFVGDVTSGSAVISNVKHVFRNTSTDNFSSSNFQMAAGDFFLHQEIERANTAGSALKVHNLVSSIDFTANTITLTETFNFTQTNYPLPFFVKVYNA